MSREELLTFLEANPLADDVVFESVRGEPVEVWEYWFSKVDNKLHISLLGGVRSTQ